MITPAMFPPPVNSACPVTPSILTTAAAAPRGKAAPAERPSTEKPREQEEFRPRPERKGKKPFVPPPGRNAGKALGGNFIGKQRLEREQRIAKRTEPGDRATPPPHEDAPAIKSEIRAAHPLGDAARADD